MPPGVGPQMLPWNSSDDQRSVKRRTNRTGVSIWLDIHGAALGPDCCGHWIISEWCRQSPAIQLSAASFRPADRQFCIQCEIFFNFLSMNQQNVVTCSGSSALRTRVILSVLSGKPLRIKDVRPEGDTELGLRGSLQITVELS